MHPACTARQPKARSLPCAGNDRAFGGQGAVSIAIIGLLVQLPVMPACINVLTRYAVWNKISGH